MELIINIDEKLYNHVKESCRYGIGVEAGVDLGLAVAQGVPLPKEHGRLIDADKIWDAYQDTGCEDFYEALDNTPTIIKANETEAK